MTIDIATLFPQECDAFLMSSIIGRARKSGKLTIDCHDIRAFSSDKHRRVDDTPYGGGMGMVMSPEAIYYCYRYIERLRGKTPHVIYMSPKGKVFTQSRAHELLNYENIMILCGHYEGVDQRIIDEIVDEEISIGDYVLTGGELGAMVVADAVGRLCDGVLSDESCYTDESHQNGLLEYPHYTRPQVWHGKEVPEVLRSGHHANINKWRREQAIKLTYERRPDMLKGAVLNKKEQKYLDSLKNSDI